MPVTLCSDSINAVAVKNRNPELIVSYNCSHIIRQDVIDAVNGRLVNLHISFLPYNRGASPNVWSFLDGTPAGVTIHRINAGLDTGDILYQKQVKFDPCRETFGSSYNRLQAEIQELFKQHWQEIYDGNYVPKSQIGVGTYHRAKDLEGLRRIIKFSYDDVVATVVEKYKKVKI